MSGQACHFDDSLLTAREGTCSHYATGETADGSFVVDLDCTSNAIRTKGRETFRGDFNKHFTQEVWSEDSGGGGPPVPDLVNFITDWTYMGPCPAGMPAHHFIPR